MEVSRLLPRGDCLAEDFYHKAFANKRSCNCACEFWRKELKAIFSTETFNKMFFKHTCIGKTADDVQVPGVGVDINWNGARKHRIERS